MIAALSSTWLYVLAVLALFTAGGSGQATTDSNDAETEEALTEKSGCSGYRKGNPGVLSTMPNCTTKSDGIVDHMCAFGFDLSQNPDWSSCDLPELPEANHRVCYRTTVAWCSEDGYRVYLNRRNLDTLLTSCPNESREFPLSSQNERFLQSPRYGCYKGGEEDNLFTYRKSDFCLYNISISNCTSGKVIVDNELHNTQELERRLRDHICSDYLQFYYGSTSSQRYCGTELSRIKLEVPTSQFLAVFWTDTSFNKLGFKLRVRCVNENDL